jgi:hypothetical protein
MLLELEGPPGPPVNTSSIGYTELLERSDEMYACRGVDPDFAYQYYNVMSEIAFARVVRLEAFLRHHNLYDQFVAADARGKR